MLHAALLSTPKTVLKTNIKTSFLPSNSCSPRLERSRREQRHVLSPTWWQFLVIRVCLLCHCYCCLKSTWYPRREEDFSPNRLSFMTSISHRNTLRSIENVFFWRNIHIIHNITLHPICWIQFFSIISWLQFQTVQLQLWMSQPSLHTAQQSFIYTSILRTPAEGISLRLNLNLKSCKCQYKIGKYHRHINKQLTGHWLDMLL